MKVFVTGASGFIGTATVAELAEHGHEVVGLARSDESAARVEAAGGQPHRGSLDDIDSLRAGAAAADAVVHLAFIHDFANFEESVATDRRAIAALGEELEGSDKPLSIASGVMGLPAGRAVSEDDRPGAEGGPRVQSAVETLALADRGVRSSVVRLAPTVHGAGDGGFVPALIGIAREKGVSGYIGEGGNHWPAVHRLDAARLFRLAIEEAPPGSVVHGIAEEGIPTRDIATAIGSNLGIPVESIDPGDAPEHFGWLARFFALDVVASNELTRERLGWRPEQPGLLADLESAGYFES